MSGSDKIALTLDVNGELVDVLVPATRTLLDVLRDDLSLTGAKKACNIGTCGSCTVLVDGAPARACICLAATMPGHEITTIEGLGDGRTPSAVQRAFVDAGAIQCGFCMPGMIVAATALLYEEDDPDTDTIRRGLAGNLCRCSGYVRVVEAVRLAARYRQEALAEAAE